MPYTHITANERYPLMYLLQLGLSYREIGRRLGRSHSSISREVQRNGREHGHCYVNDVAELKAAARRKIARHKKKQSNDVLYGIVTTKLLSGWSPDVVSGWLSRRSKKKSKRVSRETIYQWIYKDAAVGGALHQNLPSQRPKRKKHRKDRLKTSLIPNRVDISERPQSVNNRHRYGHWEGDTVEGMKSFGGIATHIERKSRYLLAGKINNKTAHEFFNVTCKLFKRIPSSRRKTLTLDNGTENVLHEKISALCNLAIYFAKPYAPWQRGANEQANGLLRRDFPKGTDFSKVSNADIQKVVNRINSTPRKSLSYRTPKEVFFR